MPVLLKRVGLAVKVMPGSLAQTMLRCNTNAGGGLPVSWKSPARGYFASRATAAARPAIMLRCNATSRQTAMEAGFEDLTEGMVVMEQHTLIVALVVGLIAGWLAGQIMRGAGFGLIGDIVVGVIGAFIGGWIFQAAHIPLHINFWVDRIIPALVGAVVLLLILRLVRR